MFEILTTRPRLGVFRSLPEKKKCVQKSVWVGSESESNRPLWVLYSMPMSCFGVVLPNSEYGTTTPRRSVSTFSADQGVGSAPYSTNRLSHGPLRQSAEEMSPKRSPRIDQLHGMSSLGPRKSSNSSGMSFRKNQSHVSCEEVEAWKSWPGLLSCTSLNHPGLPLAALPLPICKSQSSNPA